MARINRKTIMSIVVGLLFLILSGNLSPTEASPIRNRQRMMEKIETIKMWKLMEALNLDSETALKVFPIVKEVDKKRLTLIQKKRALMQQIQGRINGGASRGAIDALATRLFDLTEQICALSREEYKKLKPILTEKQMGKFLLFQQKFRRDLLRRWVSRKREGRRQTPGMKPGRAPTER